MPGKYSVEIVERAQQLYCCNELSMKKVAALTGVSFIQIRRWRKKHRWDERRDNMRRIRLDAPIKSINLREALLDSCLDTLDARDVLAFVSFEKRAARQAEVDANRRRVISVKTSNGSGSEKNVIAALEKACFARMHQLSADPGQLDIRQIGSLKAALDLVEEFRERSRWEKKPDSPLQPADMIISAQAKDLTEQSGAGLAVRCSQDAQDRLHIKSCSIKSCSYRAYHAHILLI